MDVAERSVARTAEQAVLRHLAELAAPYEAIVIEPAYAATAEFCARYRLPLAESANCIVVGSRTGPARHVACLVQATRRLDVNRTVRKRLGVRKASFAPADETERITGMLTDGVTPFGLPVGLPLLIDAAVTELPRVVVGGGSRSLKIVVAPGVLVALPNATVVDGLGLPAGG